MNSLIKGFLVCSTLISTIAFSQISYAEEEQPKDTIQITANKVIKPLADKVAKESNSKMEIGKRFFVNKPDIIFFKTLDDIENKRISNDYLEIGKYYNILDTKLINDEIYLQVSLTDKVENSVWISGNNELLYVTKQTLKSLDKYDIDKSYSKLTSDVEYYDEILINNKTQIKSENKLKKDTNVNILEKFEVETEKDATIWYKINIKKDFETKDDAEKFVKDSKFNVSSEKISKDGKDSEKYYVMVDGWVQQLYTKEVKLSNSEDNKGTLKLSKQETLIKETPDVNGVDLGVLNIQDVDATIKEYETQKLDDTKENWLAVQEIDDKGNVKENSKVIYLKGIDLQHIKYTQIKENKNIDESLVTLKEDVITLDKPELSKNTHEKNKLTKDSYFYVKNKIIAENDGKQSTWYILLDENGKDLGMVKEEKINFVKGNSLKYTIQKDESLEDVLNKFKITKQEFSNMNIELAYLKDVEFKEGLEVVVKAPEIKYDTSSVSGTQSGIQLVKDIMYTAPIITQAKIKPSVAYAQAILESGGGTSGLSTKSNNLFGIKGTYKGQGSSWATLEDSGGGNMYSINSTFRSYPNKMVSVLDYVDLITNSGIYDRAIGLDTPEQTIQAIKDSGYATDSSYVSKVMEIINKYDLTQFDKY